MNNKIEFPKGFYWASLRHRTGSKVRPMRMAKGVDLGYLRAHARQNQGRVDR